MHAKWLKKIMADVKEKKSNKDLLEELGVDVTPSKKAVHSPKEERIIAGFEEIQSFPNSRHDDQVDNLCYAIIEHFISPPKITMKRAN